MMGLGIVSFRRRGLLAAAFAVVGLFVVGEVSAASTWTQTGGPTIGQKPFGTSTTTAVSFTGKIDPPLNSGTVANICKVEVSVPGSANTTLASGDYQGGAGGSSFTVDIKRDAVGTSSRSIKVTYCLTMGSDVCVTLPNPFYMQGAHVTVAGSAPGLMSQGAAIAATVTIKGRDGVVNAAYNGFVEVSVASIGASVILMDHSHGTLVVEIVDGVGSFEIDSTEVVPGDTIYFTTVGNRLDTTRTSFDVP